ncbi:unnamed protein product [Coregonus sp. 'balchen']|nr:unnamed protein product [Coregonus sp. 'balchen']
MYYRALCSGTPTEPPSTTTGSFPHWNITEEENTRSPLVSEELSHRFSYTSYSHYTCECYQQCETPRPTGLHLYPHGTLLWYSTALTTTHPTASEDCRSSPVPQQGNALHIAMGSGPSKEHQGSSTHAAFLGQEEPAEPVILESSRYVVVALYNYPTGHPAHCRIRAGERINVLSYEGEWWKVRSSATGNESYIPSNYTARVYHRCQYEGLSRKKAEELLLLPHNQTGSFLVRESQTCPGAHSLSVRKTSDQDRSSRSLMGCAVCWGSPASSRGPTAFLWLLAHYPWPSMIFGKDNEDSLVSEGLREAISSYLFMTGDGSQKWDS